jgi:hypothetical protein
MFISFNSIIHLLLLNIYIKIYLFIIFINFSNILLKKFTVVLKLKAKNEKIIKIIGKY